MEKEKTGYPTIDKPWLDKYNQGVFEEALSIPKDKTIWQVFKPIIEKYGDKPIIEYFNRTFSGEEYLNLIEHWARTFRAIGIEPDEMVPVYGTWSPDISAMFFSLNAIGAHPYYQKIGLVPKELEKETASAKVAIVHSSLWGSVQDVFTREQFKKIIISSPKDLMCFPMKQIVSAQSFMEAVRNKSHIPDDPKIICADDARTIGDYYTGEYEVPFKPNRIATINTSSGTTSATVKGIVATNESALANIIGTSLAEPNYVEGHKAFTNLPPSIATSLNSLFLLPIYRGMSVNIDPRISEDSLYGQLMTVKPNVAIATGLYWEKFFKHVEEDIAKGKKVDLSNAEFFIMGGAGTTPETLTWMNEIMAKCGAPYGIQSGYGLTEYFGVVTVNKFDKPEKLLNRRGVNAVGLPIAGVNVGIFDDEGNELPYNHRGEVWVKGPSIMKEYFGKPEKTASVMHDGWFKTGDIAEMDEDGYLYIYGRKGQTIDIGGEKFYLFDIASAVKEEFGLKDCTLEQKKLSSGESSLVMYFVQYPDRIVDNKDVCQAINHYLESRNVHIDGYAEKYGMLELSPTTFKPKTRELTGFINYSDDGTCYDVTYSETNEDDILEKTTTAREKNFVLERKK